MLSLLWSLARPRAATIFRSCSDENSFCTKFRGGNFGCVFSINPYLLALYGKWDISARSVIDCSSFIDKDQPRTPLPDGALLGVVELAINQSHTSNLQPKKCLLYKPRILPAFLSHLSH